MTDSGKNFAASRAAGIARWILLGLVTTTAVYSVTRFWGPSARLSAEAQAPRFYCPMHPEIRRHDPGECPICHMTLEPIPTERQQETPGDHEHERAMGPGDVTGVSMDESKQKAVDLATTVVESAALGEELRVPAIVSAPETGLSEVRVRAAGFVEQVAVRQTGVKVTRGQTLAWIYSPDIYKAQEEYLALSRWQTGGAPADGTPAADMAAAARRGLELLGLVGADIEGITKSGKALRSIPVRATSSGYVTRFNAILGSRASPDTALYEIADLSTVWVVASLHERDLGAVVAGTVAHFTTNGGPILDAKIDLVEPELDRATRTARVRLVVPNKEATLRPGEFGEVTFQLPTAAGLLVPREAVIHTGQNEYVYVQTAEERFEPRLVQVGTRRGDRVQVLSGLAAGDRVVTRGSFMLDSESRLRASLAGSDKPSPSGGAHTGHQAP